MPRRRVFLCLVAVLFGCAPAPQADLVHIPALASPAPPPKVATIAPVEPLPPRTGWPEPEPVGHRKGEKIKVEWHGKYYDATVLSAAPNGKTRIHYDGYGDEWDEDVEEDRIQVDEGIDD